MGAHTETGLPAVCPHCGATARGETSWCLLCYGELVLRAPDPEPAPQPAPAPDVAPEDAAPEQVRVAGLDPAEPLPRRGDAAAVAELADRMLAELAASSAGSGDLAGRLPQSRGGRIAVVLAGAVAATALLVGAMAVLGLLF